MIEIREYMAEDWEELCRVHDAARPDELAGSCDPRAFVSLAEDDEAEELRQSTIFVATENREVIGFTAVNDDYLGWLYVHPRHYRKGVGRRLLQRALAQVDGEAWTIVLAGNKPALALYRSAGFAEAARFDSDNNGYPVTCVRMKRPLMENRG